MALIKMKTSGFTLIELTVVLSLIAVLSTTMVPPFIKAIPEINLKRTANNLAGDLKLARSFAIKRQETVGLFFNIKDKAYIIVANGRDGKADTPDDITLKRVSFGGIRGELQYGSGPAVSQARNKGGPFSSDFNGVTFRPARLYFTKNGMQAGGTGYVYVTNRNNKMCYAIGISSLAGIVVMKQTGGKGWKTL